MQQKQHTEIYSTEYIHLEKIYNHLSFHLRKLEKEEQIKSKGSRRKVIEIRIEIKVIGDRKLIQKINEAKS